MTAPDFQRSIEAFSRAHAIRDAEKLESFLRELEEESPALRREVESLLEEESASPGDQEQPPALPESRSSFGYPTIPNCQITGEIGSGGFGTVYRARRSSAELAPVAIKVLRGDKNSGAILERFKRERQLHAQMDSPYVAHVFDVGTTGEGEPYLMMELIEGCRTFMGYAEEQKLTIGQRLDLFKKICKGIEHLHLNGIYHRDLKPSNILVSKVDGRPIPKIIDFGLAKGEDQQGLTLEGVRIGTPRYMSPEQGAGEALDLRTDIYSLGVLLHELLTGTRPELARSSEEESRLPSSRISTAKAPKALLAERQMQNLRQLKRALRGDLDMIILKCIQFDRALRYQSAHELWADIVRYENSEPVLARGKSGIYALARLASRFPVATAAICVGVVALIAGVSVASIALAQERSTNQELTDANIATKAALQREEQANAALAESNDDLQLTVAFERERISSIDPAAMVPFLREEILLQAKKGLRDQLGNTSQASFDAFKGILENTNFTTVALEALKSGIFLETEAIIDSQFEDRPLLRATMLLEHADHLTAVGLGNMALSPLQSALEIRTDLLGDDHEKTLDVTESMIGLLRERGDFQEAIEMAEQAIEASTQSLGELDWRTLRLRYGLALVHLARSDWLLALEHFEELRPLYIQTLGDDHEETSKMEIAMASALTLVGRNDEAVEWAEKAFTNLEARLGIQDINTLEALYNLGNSLLRDGQYEESARVIREAYDGFCAKLGLNHQTTLDTATRLSQVLINEGRISEAMVILQSILVSREEMLGANNLNTILSLANLSQVNRMARNIATAVELGTLAVERARSVLPAGNTLLGSLILDFGRTLAMDGRMQAAEEALLEGYDILGSALGEDNMETLKAADTLSALYEVWHGMQPDAGHDQEEIAWREKSKGFTLNSPQALIDVATENR